LSILEDNNGDIWVCTLQGLWKLSIDHSTYTEYETEDGLQNASFLRGSYENGDGELFFGSMGGLVSFYPENIRRDTTDQAVVINEFNLIDKPISFDKPVEDVTKIVLSYSENSFVIDFVALYYNSPDGIKYAYKLDGFDENWNYCDAGESFTKYTNLNSGEYVFLVKAANSDGVWSDKVDSLTIVISSPFWQKWWFILSMVILLAMIIVLIVRVRTRVLNKHAQNLEKQVYERTQQLTQKSKQLENELKRRAGFSRALVHELKTPLTAVLAASSLLSTELKDEPYKSLARHLNEGANDLNFRINELFDLAKGELGLLRIERRPLDMIKLLSDVVEISKHEAYTKKQNIFLKYDPAESFVVEADELRMRQVIFNLLDNAIKFTPEGGSITIEAGMKELEMLVQVKDTGIGMTKEELKGIFQSYHSKGKHKGYLSGLGLGLSLSKMFIECHGGRIWAESDKGQGVLLLLHSVIE
jgi:signal transduction histidine kinase